MQLLVGLIYLEGMGGVENDKVNFDFLILFFICLKLNLKALFEQVFDFIIRIVKFILNGDVVFIWLYNTSGIILGTKNLLLM